MQKQIIDLVKNPVKFVELPSLDVPSFKDGSFVRTASKFESNIIAIEKLTPNARNTAITVEYVNLSAPRKYNNSIMVPTSFLCSILPPEKYAELESKYKAHQIANLHQTLSFNGSIGSDPEIFVETAKGVIIPAFNFLGSKKKPTIAPERPDHCEIGEGQNKCYWDGFQAEFETAHSFCMGWHGDSIQCGLEGIYLAAKAFKRGARLSTKTVFDIPPELLIESKPEHVQFGCMPSLNAYGMSGLNLPGHEVFIRSAGGHVHLSLDRTEFKNKECYKKMVKALDAVLGVACVSMFAKFDDPRRREMYGLAGEYRLPPHGLEYRVLSNAWLFHPLIANIVFDLARTIAMFGAKDLIGMWECSEAETIRIINTCDVDSARQVLLKNKELLIKLLKVMYRKTDSAGAQEKAEYVYDIIMKGMESVIKDVSDIAGNWNLKTDDWTKHCDGEGKNVDKVFTNGLVGEKV